MTEAHKYTTVTQLHDNSNADIIEYFDKTVAVYSVAFRQTFHKIKNNPDINISNSPKGVQHHKTYCKLDHKRC